MVLTFTIKHSALKHLYFTFCDTQKITLEHDLMGKIASIYNGIDKWHWGGLQPAFADV